MIADASAIPDRVLDELRQLDASDRWDSWDSPRINQQPISLQAVGSDEYTAVVWKVDSPDTLAHQGVGVHGVFRLGTTVFSLDTRVYSECCATLDPSDVQAVASSVVARLRQAEAGEAPNSVIELPG